MLELINMRKTYGAVTALKDVSLTIKPGEITALLGANGSGKSTLVKILGGSVKEDSGEIRLRGEPVRIRNTADAHRLNIAVAYQELSLLAQMTVTENIMLGHYIRDAFGRIDKAKNRTFAVSLFDELGVTVDPDAYPRDLPPSALSLVEIVKAVSRKPDILLLDEVTATLHHDEVEKLFAYLKKLAETNAAVVMVTHRLEEIFRVASRAVILRSGENAADVALDQCKMETVVYHMTGTMPEAHLRRAGDQAMAGAALTVRGLTIEGKVHGTDMAVNKGEIIGIGGLEGQGQSEFLRALYGIVSHSGGEILSGDGKPVRFNDAADAVKHGVGFVSGDRNRESVFPVRPIGENIYSARMSFGSLFGLISKKVVNRAAMEIVNEYDIKIGRVTDPVSSLSGGNQQKVVFGRWIYIRPDILLLDDPTKGVDVSARRELHNYLKRAADDGMTVIMVSSDNAELLDLSDRIYVFYEGGVHAVLADDERTEEKLVSAMMGLVPEEKEGDA